MKAENRLYERLLGFSVLEVTQVELGEHQIDIYCRSKLNGGICPGCLKFREKVNQKYPRKIRDLDISGRKVNLHLEVRQFKCEECDSHFSEGFEFVDKHGKVTKRQEKWIFEMCQKQPVKQVAALIDMGIDQVENIFYKYANKLLEKEDRYGLVRKLGIDEIALRKGHKSYACVLVDLERGWVIDILPDRDKALLIKHFTSKGAAFMNQIEVVTCDMWEAYVGVAKSLFKNAIIVIDRFHWMKHLNEALDSQRKLERKLNPEEEVFKSLKWKLIKNQNTLNEEEQALLKKAFEKAPELGQLYELKNTFQAIFDCDFSKEFALQQIQYWKDYAKELSNKYLDKFIKTFNNWQEWIMNYFEGRYSNGIVEGLNNSIKTIKRQAYGMLNFDHFRTRVLIYSYD